jgi:hypothetical protein
MDSQMLKKEKLLEGLSLHLGGFFQATLEGQKFLAQGEYLRVLQSELWQTEKVYGKALEKRLAKSLIILDQQLDCAEREAGNRLKTLSTNQVDSIIDCMALFTALVQKIYGFKSGIEATEYIKTHYHEFVASVIIKEDVTFSTEISG